MIQEFNDWLAGLSHSEGALFDVGFGLLLACILFCIICYKKRVYGTRHPSLESLCYIYLFGSVGALYFSIYLRRESDMYYWTFGFLGATVLYLVFTAVCVLYVKYAKKEKYKDVLKEAGYSSGACMVFSLVAFIVFLILGK